jgi:predicted nucleic acid-binding protein
MIFVDSNIFIYAVGRSHPLKADAQNFFIESSQKGQRLVTSAEVLQELLHAYLPVGRLETLDAAMTLAARGVDKIFPIDSAAVLHARNLVNLHPGLTARDLLHLAVCHQHQVKELKTFDRNLDAAFSKNRG